MHTYKSLLRRSLALLLAALLCAALGGCRESPVLQEVLYESAQEELDPDQEEIDPEDQGEEDEQLENQEREDADTQRQEETDLGLTGPQDDASQAAGVDYSATAKNDWQADGAGDGSAQNGEGEAPNTDSDLSQQTDEEDVSPENTADASLSTAKQVVDGAGRTVTLPENVETVTAVGWAAQMVEMLGGSGRLAAADSALLSSPLAQTAFSDLNGVQALWSGDGSAALSQRDFAALLALEPDVCFEVSGNNTFTNAQIAQLEEAGAAYVVLPKLNSLDNLNTSLNLLAQILDTNRTTGDSAASIASRYASWVSAAVSEVHSKTSALTSLYIAGWDGDAQYTLNNTQGVSFPTELGLAYAYSPLKAQFLTTFMAAANITNESTSNASLYRDTDYVYVTPMFQNFNPSVSGTVATYYDNAGRIAASKELFVSRSLGRDSYYELGDAAYPAVIAANESVKAQLESNFYWQPKDLSSTGYYVADGINFYHGVSGAYDIYVLPQGMCDWAEGSLESPLLAYWLACQFDGAYTLDQVKAETQSFYQTFFGTTLTDQQLLQIFGA
jgi:ABC-type Fe3+-hydroxamate transport system substrate-binding protein